MQQLRCLIKPFRWFQIINTFIVRKVIKVYKFFLADLLEKLDKIDEAIMVCD